MQCRHMRSVGDGGVRSELPLRLISLIGKVEVRVGISLSNVRLDP